MRFLYCIISCKCVILFVAIRVCYICLMGQWLIDADCQIKCFKFEFYIPQRKKPRKNNKRKTEKKNERKKTELK